MVAAAAKDMSPRMFIYGFILLALISGAIWLYTKGGSDNQTRTDLDNATDYLETRKEMDNADIGNGDADADRGWLADAANRLLRD